MVIIKRLSGQLANRLHFVSHFIANKAAHGYPLVITGFPEFHQLFDTTRIDEIKVVITKPTISARAFNRFLNLLQKAVLKWKIRIPKLLFHFIAANDAGNIEYPIDSAEFVQLAKSKILLPEGWLYRDHKNLAKYKDLIRQVFTPQPQFKASVDKEIKAARALGDVVVGVHIRRKDYIDFFNGKYYYSNEVYLNKLSEIERLFEGKKCVFVICSDEQIDKNEFANFTALIAGRQAIVDLYLLAECDYLIGPPSTFTAWASFYGNVPLNYLREPNQPMDYESFKLLS